MAGKVYFGNKNHQTWIKAPSSGMSAGATGYVAQQQLLNGRTSVKRSLGSSRTFTPSWVGGLDEASDGLEIINNFANGYYGEGPFYWLDPYAMSTNVLPPHWSAPHLTEKDWPKIADVVTPPSYEVPLFPYGNNFPYKDTYFDVDINTKQLTIIIPDGYTFCFAWYSQFSEDGIEIVEIDSIGNVVAVYMPDPLTPGSTTRSNFTSVGSSSCRMVKIKIYHDCWINAMTAMLMPSDQYALSGVPNGPFVLGRGTTALEFTQAPTMEYYSSAINGGQVGMSASLAEV